MPDKDVRFVLITGLSGAGKTQAIQCFEDLGYFCVDNLPPTFIPKFAELCLLSEGKISRVALVCDIRGGQFFSSLFEALEHLDEEGFNHEILFLEAEDDVLIRRFKETRRRHPLAVQQSIGEAIKTERRHLDEIRGKADKIINTSRLSPAQLKEKITGLFSPDKSGRNILISLISFGFKYGLPLDADLVFDVRFLPNPHYVESLRLLTGDDQRVKDYIWRWMITHKFFHKLQDMLDFLLPCYIKEGKSQVSIAIGCTGGRHRSVAIVNQLANVLKKDYAYISVEHRDLEKV